MYQNIELIDWYNSSLSLDKKYEQKCLATINDCESKYDKQRFTIISMFSGIKFRKNIWEVADLVTNGIESSDVCRPLFNGNHFKRNSDDEDGPAPQMLAT